MITIDTSRKIGPIKPVHGVNNGPTSFGGLTDLSRSYKAAGFPYARMHDPEYPHPTAVDIPQIFPDFSADETDPANYVFENTDAALKAIVDCGTQIIYRLGTSIEHTVASCTPMCLRTWISGRASASKSSATTTKAGQTAFIGTSGIGRSGTSPI